MLDPLELQVSLYLNLIIQYVHYSTSVSCLSDSNCLVQWIHGNIIQPIIYSLFSDQEAQLLVELLETYLGKMGGAIQYHYKLLCVPPL